jgi:hypothetical protein
LIEKVQQAEGALEAQERQAGTNWRQFKASWQAAWTPGRIISVGLVSGFLVGKAAPAKRLVSGGGTLQMLSGLASLFAGGSAQAAAGQARHAADAAQETATMPPSGPAPIPSPMHTPESLRAEGLL